MIDKRKFLLTTLTLWVLFTNSYSQKRNKKYKRIYTTLNPSTTKVCLGLLQTVRARHKSCFLRPDSGPCRGDIVQWYFDVRERTCYRFYYGGCQGNGNRFETPKDCMDYCFLNPSDPPYNIPHFCSLAFDYGNCFGYFYRWSWDALNKVCKQNLYSGCGGNQNNFETLEECRNTCLHAPQQSINQSMKLTTCIPIPLVK